MWLKNLLRRGLTTWLSLSKQNVIWNCCLLLSYLSHENLPYATPCCFPFYGLDANKPSKLGSYMLKVCLTSWNKPESLNHYLEHCCSPIGPPILDLTLARHKFILCLKHYTCLGLYTVASKFTLTNTDTLREVFGLIYISALISIEEFIMHIVTMTLSSFRTELIV